MRRYLVISINDGDAYVTYCRDVLEAKDVVAQDRLFGYEASISVDAETEEIVETFVREGEPPC